MQTKRDKPRERSQTPTNKAEAEFFQVATEHGWEVSKRGWPDFFCVRDGKVMVVEVKPTADHQLKESQRGVMEALAGAGIECYVWRPELGFERVEPADAAGTFKEGVVEESQTQQQLLEGSGEPFDSKPAPNEVTQAINLVWAHYVAVMSPRSDVAGEDARRIIRAALKVASVEECKRAIDGCAGSKFHMGENDRHRKYNKVGQILKGRPRRNETTRDRIDFFLDLADQADIGVSSIPSASREIVMQHAATIRRAHRLPDDKEAQERVEQAQEWLRRHGIEVVRDESGFPRFERTGGGAVT